MIYDFHHQSCLLFSWLVWYTVYVGKFFFRHCLFSATGPIYPARQGKHRQLDDIAQGNFPRGNKNFCLSCRVWEVIDITAVLKIMII